MDNSSNIFINIKNPQKGSEVFRTLFKNQKVKIEKIISNELINGKWYIQDSDEWVLLLSGDAVLEFENISKALKQGDFIFIPKLQKHRVLKTSNSATWLAIHF